MKWKPSNYNELPEIQRARAVRRRASTDNDKINILIVVFLGVIVLSLGHLYMKQQIQKASQKLALTQRDFLEVNNQRLRLEQQIAGLKDPSRIRELALAQGMIPAQDNQLAKVYAASWVNVQPASFQKNPTPTTENNQQTASVWGKWIRFVSRAEARSMD